MDGHGFMAKAMKELGHPTRLQILEVLECEGESCVCHLEQRLDLRQAYISQQLARLRNVGLVVDRREGLNVFYDLTHPSIGTLLKAAKETASALAGAQGRSITFRDVLVHRSQPCPCPKCQSKVSEIEGARFEGLDAKG
jgi:DNA-binding transcriptional ArsR family regulator